jgi:hypothetical protein
MIPDNRPDLNCFVHDAFMAFPEYLKDVDYHLIVLGPTFLCNRYSIKSLKKTLREYAFIGELRACKIALPQDDYDCSALLDKWMLQWNVDRIYTVCPEHWGTLYPNSIKFIDIALGYTGYISNNWIEAWKTPKPHNSRKIDVSYRASKLPACFGSMGKIKWQIADRFKEAIGEDSDLNLDISIDPSDLIAGKAWHSFVEDSKFCLATPSGSSLLDPYGKVRESINNHLLLHPNASFEELERHCFPDSDRKYVFQTISPRNLEAALAETVQIATPGGYAGLLKPYQHYLPLAENCSNIFEVREAMMDTSLIKKIKKDCKEMLLSEPRLRSSVFADEMITYAQSVSYLRHIPEANPSKASHLLNKYNAEISSIEKEHWEKYRLKQRFRSIASRLGARQLKFALSLFKYNKQ